MIQIVLKDIRSLREIPLEKPEWVEEKRWKNIQNIKVEADKKRSFVTAYLLDYMCSELKIFNPVYAYTERGKPFLADSSCTFNISHSGDYVVLAYCAKSESIGVDIQQLRIMRAGIEKRILHEKERSLLPEEEERRMHYLNRIWVVKESFVKLTGDGLACDFRTIYVDFDTGTVVPDNGMKAEFSLWKWEEDYYFAVCTMNKKECEIREL